MELITKIKPDFEKIINRLKEELVKIRSGQANLNLLEDIPVDYYGTKAPLKQTASVSLVGPRMIVISPWDKDSLIDIEKAINSANLGFSCHQDGEVVRITIPPLTEETRKDLIKIIHRKLEEARIAIRNLREEVREEIRKLEKEKKIAEDDKFRSQEELQKLVDEFNQKIKEIGESKEKEIMS